MKFINIVILMILLSCTWNWAKSPLLVSESVHIDIQNGLKTIVYDYISEHLPTAKEVNFSELATEAISEDLVKASFVYSFFDDSQVQNPARVQIQGYALLRKSTKVDKDKQIEVQYWDFEKLHISNNDIEFEKGIEITSDGGEGISNEIDELNENTDSHMREGHEGDHKHE